MNRKHYKIISKYESISTNDAKQKYYKEHMTDCYVAFLDILGFKNMIKNNSDGAIVALRVIKRYLSNFCNNINGVQFRDKYAIDEPCIEYLPKVTMFSDSIVITYPEDDILLSEFIEWIKDLEWELLCEGILIRGGIDIGPIYHDNFFVFGTGLLLAYKLENEVALYPRVAIGKTAMDRTLQRYDQMFDDAMENAIRDEYSDNAKDEIYNGYYGDEIYGNIKYEAGVAFVDYLDNCNYGYVFFDDMTEIREVIIAGLKNDDKRVQQKYMWLKKYFNETLSTEYKEYRIQ